MSALVKLGLLSSPFSTLFLKFPLCVQKNPAKPALLMNFVVILLCAFFILLSLFPGLAMWSGPVAANPSGGTVVHGDVRIGDGASGNLQITQNSINAIINWSDFSIDAGEMTRFVQSGGNAAVLNRVTGGNPSAIHGALSGNGNVFVVNPNGILIGAAGTIDVHGLVLSTLDVANGEFLAGGDMLMKGASQAGVTNLGRINAIGGDVFLIGRSVSNSGTVSAPSGTVGIAAGGEVLLTAEANAAGERVFVRATGAGVSGTGIFNDGTIEGASVELKAHGNLYALAINNKGTIRATGTENRGGRVFLDAPGGKISNTGTLIAKGTDPARAAGVLINAAFAKVDGQIRASHEDGSGGEIRISATDLASVGGTLDASGSENAGGSVIVEGSTVEVGSGARIDVSGSEGGQVSPRRRFSGPGQHDHERSDNNGRGGWSHHRGWNW
jgi:filamentous hemagglutinin family protein